jgi:Tfp pilus assembly protein PilV
MQDKLNQKLIQILRIAELIIAVLLLAAILIGIAGLILKTGFFEIETIKNIDFSIFLSSSF